MDRFTVNRLLVVLGILASLGVGLYVVARNAAHQGAVRAAQVQVHAAADRIALLLDQDREQLRALMHTEIAPGLMALGKSDERATVAARIRDQLPGATRVAVLSLDWMNTDDPALAMLDPACRNAIVHAGTDGAQTVVHDDDPRPHLALIEPLAGPGGQPVGIVYAQFMPPWDAWLGSVAATTTFALGAENESAGPFTIAGAPGHAATSAIYLRAPVGTSGLTMHAWSAPAGALSRALLGAAAAFAIAVLLLMAGIWRIDTRARNALRTDTQTLVGMMEDLRLGSLKPEYPVTLEAFRELQRHLSESGGQLVSERRKLEDLGLTDHLSGLPNRRAFEMRLAQNHVQARMGFPTAVLLLDIDFFKAVNDRHGHDAGDALIRAFAESIRDAVRRTDFVARLGGDEFCILFPFTDLATAFMLAERLRSKLPSSVPLGNGARHRLGWTGGLSVMMHNDDKPDEVLWRADKVLLEAKAAGRNRTFVYDSPEKLQRA